MPSPVMVTESRFAAPPLVLVPEFDRSFPIGPLDHGADAMFGRLFIPRGTVLHHAWRSSSGWSWSWRWFGRWWCGWWIGLSGELASDSCLEFRVDSVDGGGGC